MKMFNVKRLIGAVVACGLIVAANAAPADAAFLMRLSDGTLTKVISDENAVSVPAADTSDAALGSPGVVAFIGTLGVFNINASTGADLSDPLSSIVDLVSLNARNTSGAPKTLTIELSLTGLTQANGLSFLHEIWDGNISGAGTVSGVGCVDDANLVFSCGVSAGVMGPFAPVHFSGDQNVVNTVTSPYSMYILLTYATTGVSSWSGNFQLTESSVPEPGSMMLLGSGLLVLAKTARRRFGKKA